MKNNLEYDMKTRDAAMAKSQVSWILQPDPHGHLHSQGHPKLYVRKADYKLLQLKKADTTNFVDSKSEHYKLLQFKKANTTNFVDSKSQCLEVRLVNWKITETGPDLTANLT